MQALIYARFSDCPNAENCPSIETQLTLCRAFCKTQGVEVIGDPYTDLKKSRNTGPEKRPGLTRLLDDIGRGQYVIVYRADRLGAGDVAGHIRYLLKKRTGLKGAVWPINRLRNTGSADERLLDGIKDHLSEMERAVIAQRTSDAMRVHQANGRRMGGKNNIPYGKMLDPRNHTRMVDNPEELRAIAEARRLYAIAPNLRAVARAMNALGFSRRKGTEWKHQQVGRAVRGSS